MSEIRQRVHERARLQDEDEHRRVQEAKEWLPKNPGQNISHEQILADLGLAMEEFKSMGQRRAQRRSRNCPAPIDDRKTSSPLPARPGPGRSSALAPRAYCA